MNKLMKQSIQYSFVLILIFISLSSAFAAGACVDLRSYGCLITDSQVQCISLVGEGNASVISFYDGAACSVNEGTLPDILERNGCCCITADDDISSIYSAFTSSEAVCSDAVGLALYDYDDTIRNSGACSTFCRGSEVEYQDPDTVLETCEAKGGAWCAVSEVESGVLPITGIDESGKPFNTVCVPQASCGTPQRSCNDMIANGEAERIGESQICASEFIFGSGDNQCCAIGNLEEATCQDRGGSYCPTNAGGASGCIQTEYIVDMGKIGDATGSSGNTCCINGCYVAPVDLDDFETKCNDAVDNDGDGKTDRMDPDCKGEISGSVQVTGGSTSSLYDVKISATSVAEGAPHTTFTNNLGKYSFTDLAVGTTYTVVVSDSRFTAAPQTVVMGDLPNGDFDHENVNFNLGAGDFSIVSGFVKNADTNEGISDAFIYAVGTSYSALTNENGFYSIQNVVRKNADPYTFGVYANGYLNTTIDKNVFLPLTSFNVSLESTSCDTSTDSIEIQNALHVKGKAQVELVWGKTKCSAHVSGFVLERRCIPITGLTTASTCNDQFVPVGSPETTAISYVDESTDLVWNYKYEYRLVSQYSGTSIESEIVDIQLGSELCEDKAGELFCGEYFERQFTFDGSESGSSQEIGYFYGGMRCDDDNQIITNVQCNVEDGVNLEVCVEKMVGSTQQVACVDSSVCTENSRFNPFGFFSQNDCSDRSSDSFSCYEDKGETSVDSCLLCQPEMSCSDYRTAAACDGTGVSGSGNVCNADVGSGCEWEVHDAQLGLGVCKDAEVSLCESCNDNGGIFGTCDAVSCNLYSSGPISCAYSETSFFCTDVEKITCYDYQSEQSCPVGESLPRSCRFGGADGCYRDSDTNAIDDCDLGQFNSSLLTQAQCRADNILPQTYVLPPKDVIPGGDFNSDILFSVIDPATPVTEAYPAKVTYYCIADVASSSACRQQAQFKEVGNNMVRITQDILEEFNAYSTNLKLYYYSIDHANNKEDIKELVLDVDNSGPQVLDFDVQYTYNPENAASNGFMKVLINKLSTCSAVIDSIGYSQSSATPSTEHTFVLQSILDGPYTAQITCSANGESNTYTQNFNIDGDDRVSVPTPNGGVDTPTIQLSVRTSDSVECRYTKTSTPGQTFPFDQMTREFESSAVSNYYLHTADVSGLGEGPHEYFVACEYPNDEFPNERIKFSVDKTRPTVELFDSFGESFDFDIANDVHQIEFQCNDEPAGGFGCAQMRYCTIPYFTYQGVSTEECVPNTIVGQNEKVTFADSVRLCYQATENSNSPFGGAKTSVLTCNTLIAQNFEPEFIFESFPRSTQSQSIVIDGAVYVISYEEPSITLTPGTSANQLTFVGGDQVQFKDLIVRAKVDVSNIDSEPTTIDFFTRVNNDEPAYGARLDLREVSNPTLEIIKSDSILPLAEVALTNIDLTELLEISFKADGANLEARIGDYEVSATVSGQVVPGKVSVEIQGQSNEPVVSIADYKITDLTGGAQDVIISVTPYVKNILGGIELYESGKVVRAQPSADPSFTQSIILTSQSLANIQHGKKYQVSLVAQNDAGQTSIPYVQDVTFDVRGPTISSVNFEIINKEDPTQQFVIAGDNAKVTIGVYDDYSDVEKVFIEVAGIKQEVDITSRTNSQIVGVISTAGFPILLNSGIDVLVIAEDSLGNEDDELFDNALRLAEPTDFPIIEYETPIFTNTGVVSYEATVVKNRPADGSISYSCVAIYDDASGNMVIDDFTEDELNYKYSVDLTGPLKSSPGNEILTPVRINCTKVEGLDSRTLTFYQEVVYDLHNPVVGIEPQREDLELLSFTRDEKTYAKHDGVPERLVFTADEPVKCSFISGGSETRFTAQPNAPFAKSNLSKSLDVDSNPKQYEIACTDRAGNILENNKLITFINHSADQVYMYDWEPSASHTNQYPVVTSVVAYNAKTCDVSWDNGALKTLSFVESSEKPLFSRSDLTIGEGDHTYNITCYHIDTNDAYSQSESVVIDYTEPELLISLPQETTIDGFEAPFSANMSEDGTITVESNGVVLHVFDVEEYENTPTGYAIPLNFGTNAITITATDLAGNTESISSSIYREKSGVDLEIRGLSQTIVGYLPDVDVVVETAGLPISGLVFEANIYSGENIELGLGTVSEVSVSPVTFAVESANHILPDGDYRIEITAKDKGALVGRTSTIFTVDKFAPTNQIITPTERVREFDEEIYAITDYQNVLIESKDQVNVTTIASGVTQTLPVTREFSELWAEPNYLEGRSKVDVASTNDLGKTGTATQITLFDLNGPTAEIKLLGATGTKTYTPFPQFSVKLSELGKVNAIFIAKEGATSLADTYTVATGLSNDEFTSEFVAQTTQEIPEDGVYYINIELEDEHGNVNELNRLVFTLEKGDITATLDYPSFGITNIANDALTIRTDRLAICRYSDSSTKSYDEMTEKFISENGDGAQGYIHNVSSFPYPSNPTTIYVRCDSVNGGKNNETYALEQEIQLDTSNPTLDLSVANGEDNVVIIDRQPVIRATTDDETYCAYSTSTSIDFSNPNAIFESSQIIQRLNDVSVNVQNKETKTFYVQCMNGAGLTSPVKNIKVKKDISLSSTLSIISPEANFATKETSVEISIKTKQVVDGLSKCSYDVNNLDTDDDLVNQKFTTSNGTVHSTSQIAFEEGRYKLDVRCTIEFKEATRSANFFVDQTSPIFKRIETDNLTVTYNQLDARFVFDDNISGIDSYHYAIGIAKWPTTGWNSTLNETITRSSRIVEDDLDLTDGQTYYWNVWAEDKASNKIVENWVSSNGTVVEFPESFTQSTEQTCSDGILNQDETDIDCGGLICGACGTDSICELSNDCQSLNCEAGFCEAATCTDGIKNGFESDVDCGTLECGACSLGKVCTSSNNCIEGSTCAGGICADAHCSNGILDKDETDIDCGGSCASCAANSVCSQNTDCRSGLCNENVCTDPKTLDTDGDGMPDYWEDENSLNKNDSSDASQDYDDDSLTNLQEYQYVSPVTNLRTSPLSKDSDFDGRDDGQELNKDFTDPTDSSSYKEALNWALWLLLFIILIILLLGGYYGYTYYEAEQKKKNRPTAPPRTFTPQPAQRQQGSLHDELKKSLSKRIHREHKLMNEGHPVFTNEQSHKPFDSGVHEVTQVEETEEVIERKEKEKRDEDERVSKLRDLQNDFGESAVSSSHIGAKSSLDALARLASEDKKDKPKKKETKESLQDLANKNKASGAKYSSAKSTAPKKKNPMSKLDTLAKKAPMKKSAKSTKSTSKKSTKKKVSKK